MEPTHACSIQATLHVIREVERAMRLYPLAEDAFKAAKWRIAREPNCGMPVEEVNGRRAIYLHSNRVAKTPSVLVEYSQQGNNLVINGIRYFPYDSSQAVCPTAYI